MKRVMFLALFLGMLHELHAGMTWRPCEDGGDLPFIPSNVQLSPDPPVIGDKVVFSINGKTALTVPSGSLDIAVSYTGAEIFVDSKDLCKRTACPIQPGLVDIVYSQELPPIAPPGPYSVQVAATSDTGDRLMCIVVDFDLVPPGGAMLQKTRDFFGRKYGSSKTVATV